MAYDILNELLALFHCVVRLSTARLVTARLDSGRFAFPLQFSTALEWAGLFTCCYLFIYLFIFYFFFIAENNLQSNNNNTDYKQIKTVNKRHSSHSIWRNKDITKYQGDWRVHRNILNTSQTFCFLTVLMKKYKSQSRSKTNLT